MEQYISLFSQQGSLPILFVLSFLGGLIASISPCSLAMLPIIVGYVGGYSDAKPIKTFIQMLFFVFGTAIVFSIIGIICAITGKVFISFAGGYFGIILAGIILVMGLKLLGILDFELPVLVKEMPKNNALKNLLAAVQLQYSVAEPLQLFKKTLIQSLKKQHKKLAEDTLDTFFKKISM